MATCPTCQGSRTVPKIVRIAGEGNDADYVEVMCEDCEGTGESDEAIIDELEDQITQHKITYVGVTLDGMGGMLRKVDESGHLWHIDLNTSLAVRSHSPTGFSWGYHGSGPAQTALAILIDAFGDIPWALHHYQELKAKVISQFPQGNSWTLPLDKIIEVVGCPTSHEARSAPTSHNSSGEMSHNSQHQHSRPTTP